MSLAPVDALLEELAKLSHYDRVKRMVELGRRLAGPSPDANVQAIVDALGAHPNAYARLLALHTVFTGRDGARVLSALSDRSSLVRRRGRGLVHLFCDDEQAVLAIERTPPGRARASLCLRLRRARREAVVDAFVARAIAAPSPSLGKIADLLPFGTREAQARHREALQDSSGPLAWRRAAVWHPEVARADMLEMVGSGEALDPRRWWRFLTMLQVLAERTPDAAIEVLGRHLVTGDPKRHTERVILQTLALRRPAAVFDLLNEVHERSQAEAPPGVFGS